MMSITLQQTDAARRPLRAMSLHTTADNQIVLADGSVHSLDGLARDELLALQWQQEREFARRILAAPKGSSERSRVTCHAYSSVTRIPSGCNWNLCWAPTVRINFNRQNFTIPL